MFTGFGAEAPIVDAVLDRYAGRRPDARAFALQHRVLLCETPVGVPVDIALGALSFEAGMIERAVDVDFGEGVALRICSAEDLLVLKAFANRPRDQADLLSIARRSGSAIDWEAVEARLAPLAEAKGEAAIMHRVRALRSDFAV